MGRGTKVASAGRQPHLPEPLEQLLFDFVQIERVNREMKVWSLSLLRFVQADLICLKE